MPAMEHGTGVCPAEGSSVENETALFRVWKKLRRPVDKNLSVRVRKQQSSTDDTVIKNC